MIVERALTPGMTPIRTMPYKEYKSAADLS